MLCKAQDNISRFAGRLAQILFVHHRTGVCAKDTTENTCASTTDLELCLLLFNAAVRKTAQEPLNASGLAEAGSYQLVHKAGTGEHEGHEHFLVPQGLHSLLGLIWPNSPAIQHVQPWQMSQNVCPASHSSSFMHYKPTCITCTEHKACSRCTYSALMSLYSLTKPDWQCQKTANAAAGEYTMQPLRLGDL